MEGSNGGSTPDLQAILATLSQFTSNPSFNAVPHPAPSWPQAPVPLAMPFFPSIDPMALERSGTSTPQPVPPPAAEKAQDPRLRPQSRVATASPKPMIDPATITTWQEGLRCVTKIAAQNARFGESVRKMIDEQRKHEMRWYSERQALKQMQANRSTSSAKAASLLQSLTNSIFGAFSSTVDAEVDNAAELAEYDIKIYRAQLSMEEAMTAELKGLGVPFFGTDGKLVVPDGYDAGKEQVPESQPRWSQLVTQEELVSLRRRMVVHLEDLYRD